MNETFEMWIAQYDDDQLRDLVKYGASAGFPGLTHYDETVALYDRFEEEIWNFLVAQADHLNYSGVISYLGEWDTDIGNATQMKNQLVWIVAELYAATILSEVINDVDYD